MLLSTWPGDFQKLRATLTEFARNHSGRSARPPVAGRGNMDVYQWLPMISTHSQRHILQIREVKAHASYPKK